MSRIRGIDPKLQQKVLQSRISEYIERNGNKNEEQSALSKEDFEKQQMAELVQKLPQLGELFSLVRKVGEGTFSSVYLGELRRHARLPPARRPRYALKHLVPTAHPARIEHELRCLQDMGGRNNVIGVDLCLRHLDTVVFVMPYIPHRKFSEYVGAMDAAELRDYMRALLRALQHVHGFGVIHRDVKPSNFLYDRDSRPRRYLLVDFGLAQRVCPAPAPPPAHAGSALKRARGDGEDERAEDAKRLALDLSKGAQSGEGGEAPRPAPVPAAVPAPALAPAKTLPSAPKSSPAGCACSGVGGVCVACGARPAARAPRAGTQGFRPPEVLLKSPRQGPALDVWAAGVVLGSVLCARYPLLRAPQDALALAELCHLLGTRALQQAAHALGRRLVTSMPRRGLCLRKLAARLRGAPPPAPSDPCLCLGEAAPPPAPTPAPSDPCLCLGEGAPPPAPAPAPSDPCLCLGEAAPPPAPAPAPSDPCLCLGEATSPPAPARAPCDQCGDACLCLDEAVPATQITPGRTVAGFPDSAFALAARLLQPDPRRRPDAAAALRHPFLCD